jgi:hypothetical protein
LDNINQALLRVSKTHGVHISEYTLFAGEEQQVHHWFVGSDVPFDSDQIIEEMDKELCLINDDYAYVRKYNLGKPTLTIVPAATFYGFLESLGKLGAQNKMPRVLNKDQAEKWVQFVNANDSL